jgi:EAL domain-containing protein (putative c-di-GMP-specific phosphodiesterase class I)
MHVTLAKLVRKSLITRTTVCATQQRHSPATQLIQAGIQTKSTRKKYTTIYSALRYLKYFSLDILKIDCSLTHDMISNPDNSRIISANHCIRLEPWLAGFAAGVETREQFDFCINQDAARRKVTF